MGDAAGRVTLDGLNAAAAAAFVAALAGVFEDAPWVAEAVAGGGRSRRWRRCTRR